jgi:hypothetical protein
LGHCPLGVDLAEWLLPLVEHVSMKVLQIPHATLILNRC